MLGHLFYLTNLSVPACYVHLFENTVRVLALKYTSSKRMVDFFTRFRNTRNSRPYEVWTTVILTTVSKFIKRLVLRSCLMSSDFNFMSTSRQLLFISQSFRLSQKRFLTLKVGSEFVHCITFLRSERIKLESSASTSIGIHK
jgi:hypothetical protein